MSRPRISGGHVIWAWGNHILDLRDEGKSVAEIRRIAREDWGLHVGEQAIRAVLAAGRPTRR